MENKGKPLLSRRQKRKLWQNEQKSSTKDPESLSRRALRFLEMQTHNILRLKDPDQYIVELSDRELHANFAKRFAVEDLCQIVARSRNDRIVIAACRAILTHHLNRDDAVDSVARRVLMGDLPESGLGRLVDQVLWREYKRWERRDQQRFELSLMGVDELRAICGSVYPIELVQEALRQHQSPQMGRDVDHWRFQID